MSMTIYETLENLMLTSKKSRILYNEKTRDVNGLKVWKDTISGVIYIDEFYTGDNTYVTGSYRKNNVKNFKNTEQNQEQSGDAQRRFKSNIQLVDGKRVADFGCGSGDFLKLIKPFCQKIMGIELQQNFVNELNVYGIPCVNQLNEVPNNSLDIVVSFHVIHVIT